MNAADRNVNGIVIRVLIPMADSRPEHERHRARERRDRRPDEPGAERQRAEAQEPSVEVRLEEPRQPADDGALDGEGDELV